MLHDRGTGPGTRSVSEPAYSSIAGCRRRYGVCHGRTPPMADDLSFTSELRERIHRNLARFRPTRLAAEGLRHAGVGVVLLADEPDRACFVLTRRLATLRRHA